MPTPPPTLTDLPPAPNRASDGAAYRPKADAFLPGLNGMVPEVNALAAWMEDTAQEVEGSAETVATDAQAALDAAEAAGTAAGTAGDRASAAEGFAQAAQAATGLDVAGASAGQAPILEDDGEGGLRLVFGNPTQARGLGSSSGAAQAVDWANDIHIASVDESAVAFTFSGAADVDELTLVLEGDVLAPTLAGTTYDGLATFDTSEISFHGYNAGARVSLDGSKVTAAAIDDAGSGNATNMRCHQFSLNTPGDLWGGMTYDGFFPFPAGSGVRPLRYTPDLTMVYGMGAYSSGYGHTSTIAFDLSVPGDITTATRNYDKVFSYNYMSDIVISSDGLNMYVLNNVSNVLLSYTLTTAFDPSTATSGSSVSSLNLPDGGRIMAIDLSPDDSKLYVQSSSTLTNYIYEYQLTPDANRRVNGTGAGLNGVFFRVAPVGDIRWGLSVFDDKILVAQDYQSSAYARLGNQFTMGSDVALTFPASLEAPPLNGPGYGKKNALTILTTDGGASYQVASVLEGIQ